MKSLPLLPVFLLLSALSLRGQQYNFRNYSVADGLAQSQVYAMTEDARGYLWLGTQGGGLSRFDGQQFRTYTEDDSLCNGFVRCLTTDKNGMLWIGTNEGVCCFDGQRFRKINFTCGGGAINGLTFSSDGRLWVCTDDSGLVVLKDEKVNFRLTTKRNLPSNRVFCAFENTDGTMWIGTEQGLEKISGSYRKPFTVKDGLPNAGIRGIINDGKGNLWMATYGGGLVYFNPDSINLSFRKFTTENGLTNNTTHCIMKDKSGRIWVGTASGVTRISDVVKQFSENEGLCSNVVMSVLEDSWGNVWFGTSGGGACVLDGERFIHFNEKSGDMGTWVYALHCDRKGNMWFATSKGGVTEYDGMYYTNYYEGAGFTSAKVRAFGEDTSGTLWFGTVGDGAYCLKKGTFHHYRHSDGLGSNFVYAFLTDSMNREWMGTLGGAISVFNPADESVTRVGAKQGVTNDRIYDLAADESGNIFACSNGSGVYEMEYDSTGIRVKKQFTKKDGLPGNNVRSATCDKFGYMWFGTADGGIARFDGVSFKTVSKKDGLASNNIYLLIADRQGSLWVGTEKGLDKLSYDARGTVFSIKHYGKGEGLYGIETSQNAACLDTGNGVWFGTISGASLYQPEGDYITNEPPKVHLTGIRLFFDQIENTPYGIFRKDADHWFPVPDSLVLPYSENSLRFEFTGIDLRNPDGVRFRWKLDDFDKTWTPENTERQAIYSNLPPGDYVFELQARNSDGFWSDTQKFSFHITPPYYATWPFRLGASGIVLAVILLLFNWRIRIVKRRNRAQLEKITLEKHVLELEQKALRLQMNPHFIFNALQSIQGFIARNDSAEARRYLAKFGKLMRHTLDNSRQTYTSIAQEAESLEHYLGLEALCHGERFTYSIAIAADIDPDATFIPVMLIQPFVENAVKHGVSHLQERKGNISVRFRKEDHSIVCEVEDNGVGRNKSAELEDGFRKDHRSAALQITTERLGQQMENEKRSGELQIIDLEDENGNSSGTKVVIQIMNVVFE
ncbi:MAG TPA: two-component regulator propeller domain-containing protein [Bacteroidia bacterium]|nr:two-component regulator propeller domain-containing protein [Bacteroidia bacterium]